MKDLIFFLFFFVPAQSFTASIIAVAPIRSTFQSTTLNMAKEIKEIQTNDAPAPVGPYSQAVLAGSTLYCSGSIALDPTSGEFVGGGDVQEEARQCLKNMDAILKASGASASNVVRCKFFKVVFPSFRW